jgi:hypothetical protein
LFTFVPTVFEFSKLSGARAVGDEPLHGLVELLVMVIVAVVRWMMVM